MKRISVLTQDEFLYKKIALSLDFCEVLMSRSPEDAVGADVIFHDVDTVTGEVAGAVTVSRKRDAALRIPFSLDAPADYVCGVPECRLLPESRSVILGEREIRLTEIEYALFSLIVEAKGAQVSREEILEQVWSSDTDGGVVNVYVHYLREKLECGGERVIAASRGKGYSLTPKYAAMFGGGSC